MRKKIICFLGFIVYLTLLNLLFWSIGTLVVPEYNNYSHSGIYLESIIFVSVQSFIQVFIFRIEKKNSIFLMSVLYMLFNFTFMNIGNTESKELYWDIFSSIMYSVSQFSLLTQSIISNITFENILASLLYKMNYYVLFPCNLAITAYSYKLLFDKFISKFKGIHCL